MFIYFNLPNSETDIFRTTMKQRHGHKNQTRKLKKTNVQRKVVVFNVS